MAENKNTFLVLPKSFPGAMTMAFGGLAKEVVRVLAAIILTYFFRNIQVSVSEALTFQEMLSIDNVLSPIQHQSDVQTIDIIYL